MALSKRKGVLFLRVFPELGPFQDSCPCEDKCKLDINLKKLFLIKSGRHRDQRAATYIRGAASESTKAHFFTGTNILSCLLTVY